MSIYVDIKDIADIGSRSIHIIRVRAGIDII